eukprot:TRINITY_DN5277_c0_g2_i1.p1 TRINITY_DN5277_c0_g2~~TRINITY_DN5277_c0_g2_i1.p1  ORF type:complete len:250 (+),score=16.50 TRINITY_DN5277_c0_g2_i1:79-828(+)
MWRQILRLRSMCIDSENCVDSDKRFQNFNRLIVKTAEHSWGLNISRYLDNYNWENKDFHKALQTTPYQTVILSWEEQRDFIYYAIKALRDHPLATQINQALKDMKPSAPSINGFTPVSDYVGKVFNCSRFGIGFSSTGAIQYLYDNKVNKQWSSNLNTMAQFYYTTVDSLDYATYLSQYLNCDFDSCPWYYKEFGKYNLTGSSHRSVLPRVTSFYTQEDEYHCSYLLHMNMDVVSWTCLLYTSPSPRDS